MQDDYKVKDISLKDWQRCVSVNLEGAFLSAKYSIPMMKKDIKDESTLKWVLDFDKKDHASQVKNNMRPFEVLFFEVGSQI